MIKSDTNGAVDIFNVSSKFDVRPSRDDFRNHRSLMKQFAEKDSNLAKSEVHILWSCMWATLLD
jgi:hypothetical protein